MLHNIATSKVAPSRRFESVSLRVLSAIVFFILVQGLPLAVSAQCATDGLSIGAGSTHVDLDGSWAVRGTGSSVEMLKEEAGSWSSLQSIDLAGATLTSLSLDSDVLAVATSGQVQVYSHDGTSWLLEETLLDADPTFGYSVALSGGTLAVGSPGSDTLHFYSRLFTGGGAVVWVEATTITGGSGDVLGEYVSMAGDYASATAPGANEVSTYQFAGLQQNEWSLVTTLPYDHTAGSQVSLDFSGGELRLLTPTATGAEVRLLDTTSDLWLVDGVLTYAPAADPSMVLSEDKVLVHTDCGMRLYLRTASGWNNGVALETFDETLAVSCVPIPAGSTAEPMAFGGARAIIAETSATWLMDEFSYADCNNNSTPDRCDLLTGFPDCNSNGIPDSCDFANGDQDCNGNGIIDSCEVNGGLAPDCNGNGVPDPCDLIAGVQFDTLPPVITNMPADVTVQIPSGLCQGVANWAEPSASDVCSNFTLTPDFASGSIFPSGPTTVTYTAEDEYGNIATASFVVNIEDPNAPVFTFVPENIVAIADPISCGQNLFWDDPIAVDFNGCSEVTMTSSVVQGSHFFVGSTAVVFTATDAVGNLSVAVMSVTLIDDSPPVIQQLPDIHLDATSVNCSAIAVWAQPTVTDCSGISLVADATPPIQVGVADRVVNYTATDPNGFISTMSFSILVEDVDPPFILNVPADLTLNPEPGTCGTTLTWDAPVVNDNCIDVELLSNFDPPSTFGVGTTVVEYTATDTSGNVTTAGFNVTIIDPDDPEFITTPGNVLVGTNDDQCGSIVEWEEPQAIDCSSAVAVTSTHQPGEFFPIGTTEVTYTATDVSGKVTNLTFPVTVTDGFAPTFVTAPGNVLVDAIAGLCSAEASWAEPTVTDGCNGFSVVSSHQSATVFAAGNTQVTYTATDDLGNAREHTFFVTVNDGEGPTFDTQVANIAAPTNLGICSAQIFWTEPTAVDNCTAATITRTHSPGSFFDVGVTTVTYTASDGSGEVAVQSFTVTIEDGEAPDLFQMPLDIVVPNTPGTCEATVTWNPPTAIDHCDAVTSTGTSTPGSSFQLGSTVVTYTSADLQGNQASESFTVTVQDTEIPFFTSSLPDAALVNDPGECSAVLTWEEPTAEDLCGLVTMTSNHPSGTAFPLGTTTVTYTATDESANEATFSFEVTVADTEAPQFVGLPQSFTSGTTGGGCEGTVSWIEPAAQDCSLESLTSSHVNGSIFPLGDTDVTYTALDTNGNESTGTFTVTVVDDDAPEYITFPPGVLVSNEPGTCSAAVTWTDVDAQDNCSIPTIVLSHSSGDTFGLGVTIVSAQATDDAGNVEVKTFTVTVLDQEDPVVDTAPASPLLVSNTGGACELPATWDAPTFSDICTADPVITSTHQPGDLFPVGDTEVIYTATDDAQNSISSSLIVRVLDSTPPFIESMPPNLQVSTPVDSCEAAASWTEPSTSDCSLVTASSDIPNGTVLSIGHHIVTYTFTDEYGNDSTEDFLVTVVDGEAPQIHGVPADITVNNGAGSCSVAVVWPEATTTDCVFSGLDVDHASGSEFTIGTTTVTYTASDSQGNQSTASFLVTVEDIEAPQLFNMPPDIEVTAAMGSCEAAAFWVEPTALDCVSFELSSSASSGSSFPIGDNVVTYTATDPSGNEGVATFTVTVHDQEDPLISQLPLPIQVNSMPDTCQGIATWTEPTAADCSGILSLIPSHPSGSDFPIGTTAVTYTATDGSGNTSELTFTVTVVDVGDPVILQLPDSLFFDNIEGNCAGIATWTTPLVEDCSGATLTSNYSSGNVLPLGTHVVTYTAVDTAGNSAEASFEVTIEDAEMPFYVNLPAELSFQTTPGQCDGVATWNPPVPVDLCGDATSTSSHESGVTLPIGVTEVTHTATDDAGNTASYTTVINMLDGDSPLISDMPADIVLDAPVGSCSLPVTWDPPTVTDCTEVTLTPSIEPGSEVPIGIHVIVYTATDIQNNIAESFFTVTILDIEPPQISNMPTDMVLTNDEAQCGAVVSWTEPLATDCSNIASLTSSMSSGSFFGAGDTLVTYTATDDYGNASSASFNVNVVDKDGPVISGLPSLIQIPSYPGQCGANAFWSDPVITDNCEISTIQANTPPGSFFPVGESSVIYIAVDVNENASTHELVVLVHDAESPQIVNLPGPINLLPDPGECQAVATWLDPEFIDNCPGGSITISIPSGSSFPVGTTDVEVTATDEVGNVTTELFSVTVDECQSSFLRGDTNDDGTYDISDAIYILGYIFSGAADPTCMDALDENDDGQIQIADAIYHFSALFMGGSPPAAPYDSCGVDPTPDSLDCEGYQSCP
ncbi:MAG: HYR domain-containing protein [Planctomycetota bacterium]|nr:HYR domain-containing protein [Planctomycetota bacterium]